jgi:hypothetical protein
MFKPRADRKKRVLGRLLWLAAISNQASHDVNETVDRTAMAQRLNPRDVFELIYDTFEDGSFAQKEFVHER